MPWRIITLAGAIGLCALVWFLTTKTLNRTYAENERAKAAKERETQKIISESQREYASIPMTSLGAFAAPGDVVRHISTHTHDADLQDSEADGQEAALQHAAEFIYYRVIQDSPEDYRAWRTAYGYSMKPIADMGRVDLVYKRLFGEDLPEDDPATTVDDVKIFDDMWSRVLVTEDGKARPVGIPDHAAGFDVAIGDVDLTWSTVPTLSGQLGQELWQGGQSLGFGRNWWTSPARTVHEILKDEGQATLAIVGVVLEMQAGDRYPFSITMYQSDGTWWIWRLNAYNVEHGRLLGWAY